MNFDAWSVIKWILIVLLAAFIGHFGKVLAQSVMARFRSGKSDAAPTSGGSSFPSDPAEKPLPPLPSPGSGEGSFSQPTPSGKDRVIDKKTVKAAAKQTKKALKKK